MRKVLRGREVPELVRHTQVDGKGTFYLGAPGQRQYFDFHTDTYKPIPTPGGTISLQAIKAKNVGVAHPGDDKAPLAGSQETETSTQGKGVLRDNGSAT